MYRCKLLVDCLIWGVVFPQIGNTEELIPRSKISPIEVMTDDIECHGFRTTRRFVPTVLIDGKVDMAEAHAYEKGHVIVYNGYAHIRYRQKYGLCKADGSVVVEPRFDSVGFMSKGMARILSNGKWGFVNDRGDVVIGPQFDDGRSFSSGLAAVKKGDKWGFINKEGTVVVPFNFDDVREFNDGLAPFGVRIDPPEKGDADKAKAGPFTLGSETWVSPPRHNWGLIDRSGEVLVEAQFDDLQPFRESLALAVSGERIGFLDTQGKLAIKCSFTGAQDFHEGRAMVTRSASALRTLGFASDKTDYFYIDTKGNQVGEKSYENGTPFAGGLAGVQVEQEKNWGIINRDGRMIVPPQYQDALFEKNSTEDRLLVFHKQNWWTVDRRGKPKKRLVSPEYKHLKPNDEFRSNGIHTSMPFHGLGMGGGIF